MQKNLALNRFKQPLFIGLGILIAVMIIAMIYLCLIKAPSAHAADYPIQGFDVSHHQQEIQWQQISPEKYRFVYLKATEGGDFKDTRFQENWLKARERGFLVGAYHFYRLCRDGSIQAQNFIDSVPKQANALPPVIDLEYDSNCINTYSKEQLLNEIQIMHDALQKHYANSQFSIFLKHFIILYWQDIFPKCHSGYASIRVCPI